MKSINEHTTRKIDYLFIFAKGISSKLTHTENHNLLKKSLYFIYFICIKNNQTSSIVFVWWFFFLS